MNLPPFSRANRPLIPGLSGGSDGPGSPASPTAGRGRIRERKTAGFALVITLLVIALLTVIVTAFLTSSSTDRLAARAYLARVQAEAAARGGADEAMATLKWAFESFPDSATMWNPTLLVTTDSAGSSPSGSQATGGTEFWFHATGQTQPDPPSGTNNFQRPPTYDFGSHTLKDRLSPKTFAIPLVSGLATLNDGSSNLAATPPTYSFDSRNPSTSPVVDLNVRISTADICGWIGSPSLKDDGTPISATAPQPMYAPWIERKDAAGLVVARYAWWAEDESFRVNVNFANADAARGDNSADPVVPLSASDVSLITALRGALGRSGNNVTNDALLKAIYDARQNFLNKKFPDSESYYGGSPSGGATFEAFGPLRFLLTSTSSGLNLSRHGSARLGLDRLGSSSDPLVATTPTDSSGTATIQRQVDRLTSALAFHLPNLGQRFFRDKVVDAGTANAIDANLSSGTDSFSGMSKTYFFKTAASIRDYVDQDSVPTVLSSSFGVLPAGAPTEHPGENQTDGLNPMAAIGKESGPFIHKAAAKYQATFSGLNFTLVTNYYVVLWNPSDRDINVDRALGDAAFVLFRLPTDDFIWVDQKGKGVVPPSGDPPQNRHIKIFFPRGATLPARSLTLVTTDTAISAPGMTVIRPPAATVSGTLQYTGTISALPGSGNAFFIKMVAAPSSTGNANYEHNVVLGSNSGFIDGAMGCPPLSSLANLNMSASSQANTFARGGRLIGNDPPSSFSPTTPAHSGDSRSNSEQIYTRLYMTSSNPDATRFLGDSTLTPTGGYNDSSLVSFVTTYSNSTNPNTSSTTSKEPWADYFEDIRSQTSAAAFLAAGEGGIRSIGELGNVYDASRRLSTIAATTSDGDKKYTLSRGGGRSFRIGQPDDLIDPRPLSPSREGWASWRLTDVLSVNGDLQKEGLLNINGLLRDHGVALRAALAKMTMQPSNASAHGTPSTQIGGLELNSDHSAGSPGIESLSKFLSDRFRRRQPAADQTSLDRGTVTWGPLFERGEVSECPYFSQSSSPLFSNANLAATYDRGREEVFRRMAEMITTKGNTFSVYCVGQSIQQTTVGGVRNVLSTQRMKVTFRLKPVFLDSSTNPPAPYNPTDISFTGFDQASLDKRFARPSRYDIEVLEVSPGP